MSGLRRVRWVLPLVLCVLSACASAPIPGEARLPAGAVVTHRAVFIGTNSHDTMGTISLYQSRDYPVIVFESNFSVSDPAGAVVALGTDGYRADTVLGALLRPAGRQAYALPPGLDIRRFNEVWLWSPTVDKPVGLARLTPIRAGHRPGPGCWPRTTLSTAPCARATMPPWTGYGRAAGR